MKYFEKRKLVKFLKNINKSNNEFPDGYLDFHKNRIEWLEWLIASYDGKTAKPKMLLESLIKKNINDYDSYVEEMERFNIKPMSEVDSLKYLVKHIEFIYNWVYYKKITGF
jgi:CTP:phosphocholine cytidylyltransferase-like protein